MSEIDDQHITVNGRMVRFEKQNPAVARANRPLVTSIRSQLGGRLTAGVGT